MTGKDGKFLHKSSDNKIFSGVCGGIGEYFGIDPTLVRLLWGGLTCVYGTGLLFYIVACLVIPKDNTPKEK